MASDHRSEHVTPSASQSLSSLATITQDLPEERLSQDEGHGNSSISSDQLLSNLQNDAETQKRKFNEALTLYQAKTAGTKYQMVLDFSSLHTWDEVLQSVDDASKLYNEVPGAWGKIRKGLRRFGKTEQAFQAWSALLPSQSEYFSILCGGIKLICGAAARLEDLRAEVANALEEIPYLISITHKALGIFQKSDAVQSAAVDLYVTTLAALGHIVRWYAEKATKKLFKSIFKQDLYQTKLTEKIQAIRGASDRFERAVQFCSYEHIISTRLDIREHQRLSRENYQELLREFELLEQKSMDQSSALRGTISDEAAAMRQIIRFLINRVSGLETAISGFVNSSASIPASIGSRDMYSSPLSSHNTKQLCFSDSHYQAQAKFGSYKSMAEVLSFLSFNPSDAYKHLDNGVRSIESLPRSTQDRVAAIIQAPQFQNWMASPAPEALFINYNSQASASESPSFYLYSKLHDSVHQGPGSSLMLSFFCRSHIEPGDLYFGAAGMVRSLIGQLLDKVPQLPFQGLVPRDPARAKSVSFLCGLLEDLILRLPPDAVVFCAIDSINIHEENNSAYEEIEEVVETLVQIRERTASAGCAFKLIIACSWNSHRLYKLIPDQKREVMWLPVKVPHQGGLTTAKWKAIMEKNLRLLR